MTDIERSSPAGPGTTTAPVSRVTRITAAQLTSAGHGVAFALDEAGVPVRGGVAVLAENTPEFLAAYRGATWSGRVFTPLSWRWNPDEVAYVVGNCEAQALVVDARHAHLARDAAARVPAAARFAFGGPVPGFRDWSQIDTSPAEPHPAPLCGATMLYTSGTTGRPKGVRRAHVDGPPPGRMGRGGMRMLGGLLDPDDPGSHLVCTPLYHAGPLSYADGAALLGSDLVLMERFSAEDVLRVIERYRVTSTFMVPTQFVRLLRLPAEVRERYDVSSLRLIAHGSAPVAPDVKRAMIDWFGPVLHEFYGGTEGGGVSIGSAEWLRHPGSVGRPAPGMLEIRDESGRRVGPGVEGMVWFFDDTPFEYKDDPDKTAQSRDGNAFTLGDIGYLDTDGYLFLCDRRADVIISGGVNIYPAQVEAVLLAHPAVLDCCVVGVPDDEWGESVRAVVTPAPGHEAGPELAERLRAHCAAALAGPQRPKDFDFDAALPRTETGKLARRTIRERYWAGRDRRI